MRLRVMMCAHGSPMLARNASVIRASRERELVPHGE